jgi:protein-arginine kinase
MKTKHLGYLTTDPKNLGTGLKISVRIKLPKLSKDARLQTLLKIFSLSQSYRIVNELQSIDDFDLDEDDDRDKSILEISSIMTLGKSEVNS